MREEGPKGEGAAGSLGGEVGGGPPPVVVWGHAHNSHIAVLPSRSALSELGLIADL